MLARWAFVVLVDPNTGQQAFEEKSQLPPLDLSGVRVTRIQMVLSVRMNDSTQNDNHRETTIVM